MRTSSYIIRRGGLTCSEIRAWLASQVLRFFLIFLNLLFWLTLSLPQFALLTDSESIVETKSGSMVFNMCFPKSGGNGLARSTSEERKKNLEIEKMIRKDKKTQARQVKILLLGAGESGKSTILKQMRIIYSEGFRLDERKEVRQVIFSNMIVAFKIIAEEMRELGLEYQNEKSSVHPYV